MRIQIELAERGVVFEEVEATYQRMEQEIGHKIEGPVYDNPNDCAAMVGRAST